jgi:curved DNA-binding protein CbpA
VQISTNVAMNIFGYNSIKEIKLDELHRKYREIMKKIHPDIGGDPSLAVEVNIAYDHLSNICKSFQIVRVKSTEELKIISLFELLNHYHNKFKIRNNFDDKFLNNATIIKIPLEICYGGEKVELEYFNSYDYKDKYNLNVKLNKCEENNEITVIVLNKQIRSEITGRKEFRFKFDYGVQIKVYIETL